MGGWAGGVGGKILVFSMEMKSAVQTLLFLVQERSGTEQHACVFVRKMQDIFQKPLFLIQERRGTQKWRGRGYLFIRNK